MDDKITVEFDADTMNALSRMAEAHGRGVDAEVREIVSRTVRKPMSREEFVRRANEIAAMTPKGIVQTDSAILVREDRDR